MARYNMRNFMTEHSCNLGLHGRPTQQLEQASVHNHLSSWDHKRIDLVTVNDSKLPLQALQSYLVTRVRKNAMQPALCETFICAM